jgi:hypothetical protein
VGLGGGDIGERRPEHESPADAGGSLLWGSAAQYFGEGAGGVRDGSRGAVGGDAAGSFNASAVRTLLPLCSLYLATTGVPSVRTPGLMVAPDGTTSLVPSFRVISVPEGSMLLTSPSMSFSPT